MFVYCMEPEKSKECEEDVQEVGHSKEYIEGMKAIKRLRQKLLGYC